MNLGQTEKQCIKHYKRILKASKVRRLYQALFLNTPTVKETFKNVSIYLGLVPNLFVFCFSSSICKVKPV